ncbi:MAG: TonB-dependent receptor [Betaproteobacteria bacterium]|nr:TonB-dependent receptor [Betaproteobacteria bacterium]
MKEIKRKKLATALVQALGAGVALSIVATGASAQQTQKIDKIEVTGSNIKRVDTETVAPVEVITREQIERSGQPTIADALRNLPANSGSFGESFTNSFAPGASGISLRGLGQKSTLVLINGRRVAGYGFAQNLQDTFVDLNSIPSSAVERVEILKDGASAVYGSDAIAGVVNVIMRKDYKGIELGARYGEFEGKNDVRFNITGGMGDLAKDRWNVMGTLDYFKRDLLLFSETDFGHSRDMRGYPGGRNNESLTGAGTWRQLSATNALTANFRAISECPGTVLTGPQAVARGLIAAPLGNTAFNIPGNTFCSKDFADQFTALPETERIGFLGRATFDISDKMRAYAEVGLSTVDTFQTFQAPFFAGTTGLTQTSAGLRPFTYNINFAPGVSGNPFTSNARYTGVQADLGTRNNDISSDSTRFLAGLNWTAFSMDFDSAVGYSKNEVESQNQNRMTLSGTSAAFGVPSTPQPPIPTSTSATYNLDRPSTNTQAVRDSVSITFPRKSESELKFIDTRGSTEFGKLPGGPIGIAVGAEWREEKLSDRPDATATSGNILGQGITATDGSRRNYAVFTEISLPFTQMIEANLAFRHDNYSDYGSSTVPKAGIKIRPTSNLLLRANWGEGFRAPTLPEISPSVATFFTSVTDPLNNQITQISGVFAGNPNLEAEKSKSWTAGFVWEPLRDTSVGVSYYNIEWKNIVAAPSFQSIVNAGGPNVIRDPNNNNAIVTVLSGYTNANSHKTSGIDLDARAAMSTGVGKFTSRLSLAYMDSYKEDGVECAGTNGCTNTYPRTKYTFAQDWDTGPWSFTAQMNYVRGYQQQLLPGSFFTAQDPQFQNGTFPDRIPHYRSVDIFARYTLSKSLSLSASIVNAEDAKPPYDPGFSTTTLYDFSQYSVVGRQVRLGVNYKM